MIIDNKRALAYSALIDEILPIEKADNIELARIKGWYVIVKKNTFHVNDLCIFFEIDSQLPEADWSAFLANKHYKVKIYKLGKFNVISQGLAIEYGAFPEDVRIQLPNTPDVDVTDLLGVTYSNLQDNVRKSNNDETIKNNHKKFFKNPIVKFFMKYSISRTLILKLFSNKKLSKTFPTHFTYVHKTDEERVENMPFLFTNPTDDSYVVTEKLDGTSCTYILERKKFNKFEFYVCSRNVRYYNKNQNTYHNHNIYWELAEKYNIEAKLKEYLNVNKSCNYVCIQGEGVGNVQGNPLKLKENELYVFNFIDSVHGRYDAILASQYIHDMGMKYVPILSVDYHLPYELETLKEFSDGKSKLNPSVLREGLVLRNLRTDFSFKSVSREYMLKHS